MFELGQAPGARADAVVLADYIETECLKQPDRNASVEDVLRAIGRWADDGERDEEATDADADSDAAATLAELALRKSHSGDGYPFEVNPRVGVVTLREGVRPLYLFTLVATAANMTKHGRKGNVDATALFERICAEVARFYWGPGAKSHVFSTGRSRSETGRLGFRAAVNSLCRELSEGGQSQNRSGSRQTPSDQDDGLDVVVWSQSRTVGRASSLGSVSARPGLRGRLPI